jgi:hypothetical protein
MPLESERGGGGKGKRVSKPKKVVQFREGRTLCTSVRGIVQVVY